MKKLILTIATIVIAIIATTSFTYASTKNNFQTVLNSIGNFNNIEIRGNVEVYVSNGTKDEVTVGSNYYAENALIQNENGLLRISSYKKEKIVIYVTASDLHSISVYDNAVVASEGRLSALSLNINLYNNAYADLYLDNYATNLVMKDHASANLSGNVVEYTLAAGSATTVNRAELVALTISETKIQAPAAHATIVKKTIEEEIALL